MVIFDDHDFAQPVAARGFEERVREAFARLEASGADEDLVALVKRCLAPSKAARPADAGKLAAAIGRHLGAVADRARRAEVAAAAAEAKATEERKARRLTLALAAAVGVGGALAGALGPAIDISRRHPRSLLSAYNLHERVGGVSGRLAAAGVGALVAAIVAWPLYGRFRPAGFVLALALLVAVPLAAPWTVRTLAGRGYEVVAVTGKASEEAYLKDIGARSILVRDNIDFGKRPLEKAE